jgi:hypothetical protein
MTQVPLRIPPGLYLQGTEYQAAGRWRLANMVRWYEGTLRPIGGWVRRGVTLEGICRAARSWRDNGNGRWVGFGTHTHLYAYNGDLLYDITPEGYTPGRVGSIAGSGFGAGPFGAGLFGTDRTSSTPLGATVWSLDTWGENLVGVASHEGVVYEWTKDVAEPAEPILNAPSATSLLVTDERILMVFGAGGDPRRARWSGAEDNTIWTPSSLNQAGGFSIQTSGALLGGIKVRGGYLVFTSTDVHFVEYQGPPAVYGFRQIAPHGGPLGINAVIPYNAGAAWMSRGQFWRYAGGPPEPIPCEVSDYVFRTLNEEQAAKIYGGHNSLFGELIWFYPGPTGECTHWVSWSYRENHWNVGEAAMGCCMARTAWVDSDVFTRPFAVHPDGTLFQHETGWTADGAPRGEYARSGPIEMSSGDRTLHVTQTLPDELTEGDVQLRFFTKFAPKGEEFMFGPYQITRPYMDTRFSGRQAEVQIEGVRDVDWRVGTLRLDGRPGGRR